MKEQQKQWLTWGILTLVTLAVALFFGVQYPLPKQPDQYPEPIELGANFSNPVDIEGSSSASAPALTFEDDTDSGIFRSAANTLNVAAGGTEYLEIDSSAVTFATDIDMDGPIDLDGTADEVQLAVTGYTTQTSDLVTFDGGLVDVGGGSAGTADGDNDMIIAGDLEVDDELDVDGAADIDGLANLDDVDIDLSAAMNIDGELVNIGGATGDVADGDNDLLVTAVLEVDGELEADGTIDADAGVNAAVNQENVGALKTVLTSAIITTTDGALWTVADGEVWIVHNVFCNVTTNFDCTGDDCIIHIGDGNDEDGFLDLDDGELQTTDTEGTGGTAGWQGYLGTDTNGAYFTQGLDFIYAPSGSSETIDIKIEDSSDQSNPTGGAATCYLVYTRIE